MDSATTETLTPCQTTAVKLVEDLGSMLDAILGIASRLEFIGGGLGVKDPSPRGAALAVEAAEMATLDLVDDLKRMTQCARELAEVPYMLSDSIARAEEVRS